MNIDAIKKFLALPVEQQNKTKAAAECNVSPRSFGRWLDKYKETTQQQVSDTAFAKPKAKVAKKSATVVKKETPVVPTKKEVLRWFVTKENIMMTLSDGTNVSVVKGHDKYAEILAALVAGNSETAVNLSSEKKAFEALFGKVEVKGGKVYYKGKLLSSDIASVIVERAKEGNVEDVTRYAKFLSNLMENPSFRSTQQLYGFLKKFDIVIDEDGMIEAWKVVRSNYFDKHSGKFDNSVGRIVKMDRNEVDDDPSRTCSTGLHLCSKDYIKNFYRKDDRILKCILNPRDAISVPSDYHSAKLRACEYIVKSDVTEAYLNNKI